METACLPCWQGRAWPPTNGYTLSCWLRRAPSNSAVAREPGEEAKKAPPEIPDNDVEAAGFTVFEFETTDEHSFVSVVLVGDSLVVSAGSRQKPSTQKVPFPHRPGWVHLTLTHERRRPGSASKLVIYVDGLRRHDCTLAYPTMDCCHDVAFRQGYLWREASLQQVTPSTISVQCLHLGTAIGCSPLLPPYAQLLASILLWTVCVSGGVSGGVSTRHELRARCNGH